MIDFFSAFVYIFTLFKDDAQQIVKEVDELEKSFEFVIILEYYIESVILLAAHLNMPLEFMYVKAHKIAQEYPQVIFFI